MGPSRLAIVLYHVGLAVAGALVAAVLVAPFLPPVAERAAGGIGCLFARDLAVRRAALAGAAGLAVSACVFFRPQARVRRPRQSADGLPPPTKILGA